MELEVSEEIGAKRYQRTKERKTYRNGYCKRRWNTRVGTIHPSCAKAATSRSLLEPRRTERALGSVVQEAYVQGVSTREAGAKGGRPGTEPGDRRDLKERGIPDLRGAGRGAGAVPQPSSHLGVPLCVATPRW